MQYVIDGYNLLHQVGLLSGTVNSAGLARARRALLTHLVNRLGPNATDATVVFDARQASPRVAESEERQGVRVVFTRGEEADDLIETLIRQAATPRLLTVVSNDRRLRVAAERRGCPVADCVTFWDEIGRQANLARQPPDTTSEARSAGDAAEWLREFGDIDNDLGFRNTFGMPRDTGASDS